MNKQHLQAFIDITIKARGEPETVQEDDKSIFYRWRTSDHLSIEKRYTKVSARIQEYIKYNGWVITLEAYRDLIGGDGDCIQSHFHIRYSKERDSISLGYYDSGYRIAETKGRIYPVSKNVPLLCISKKIYCFAAVRISKKLKRFKYKPRLYSGMWWRSDLVPYLSYLINPDTEVLQLPIPYRYMILGEYDQDTTLTHTVSKATGLTSQDFMFLAERTGSTKSWSSDLIWLMHVAGGYKNLKSMVSIMRYRQKEGFYKGKLHNTMNYQSSANFLLSRQPANTRYLPF